MNAAAVVASSVRGVRPKTRASYVAAFAMGLFIGSLGLTFVLSLFGVLLLPVNAVVLGLVASFALALVLRELGLVRFRLPSGRFLIPQSRFRFGMNRGLFVFGAELAAAYRTVLPGPAPYLAAAVVVLEPSLITALLCAAAWASTRSIPVVLAGVRPTDYGEFWFQVSPTSDWIQRSIFWMMIALLAAGFLGRWVL